MTDYIVKQTKQLENGVWVIAKGDQSWDDELNYDLQKLDDLIGEVKAIPKSGKLEIIQGDQKLGEFDPKTGTNARIEIPEPNDLGDLTLTQGGKTLGFYRGNAKTIDIPVPKEPETLTIKQAGKVLGTYSGEAAEITIPKAADPVKLTVKQGSNILGTYIPNQSSDAVISIPIPPDQTTIEPLVITQNGVTLGTYDGTDATIDIPVPQVTVGKLTVKQGAMTLGVYSGSELQIDIPENPAVQTLTLKQGENVLGTYSGSEEEIEIPEQKIGTLTVTKGSISLGSFTSDESATIDIPENKTLTIKQNGTEIGTYSGLYDTEINLTDTKPQTLTIKQGENVLGTYDGTANTITIPESGESSGFNPSFDSETYVPVYVNISSEIEFISDAREYLESNSDLETENPEYYQELVEKATEEEALIEELRTSDFKVMFKYPRIELGDVSETITYQYFDNYYNAQEKTEEFEGKAYIVAIRPDEVKDLYSGISYRISGMPSGIDGNISGYLGGGSGSSGKNKYWCRIKIIADHGSWNGSGYDISVNTVLSVLKMESDLTERTFKTMRTVFLAD